MTPYDPTRAAELVASIHAPWRATVGECLSRWAGLDPATRAGSYLIVHSDEPGSRRTLNGARIAELAANV
ncbi:hypothetical protein [uncultured Sphingomonas sp.]|uniref:hypothetical protein n=1 Tax=uncultured Sphingomonas sp. TaxID=158754 RepID=UPI0035CA7AB7